MGFIRRFLAKNKESKKYFFEDRLKLASDFIQFLKNKNSCYYPELREIALKVQSKSDAILNAGPNLLYQNPGYSSALNSMNNFIEKIYCEDSFLIAEFLEQESGNVLFSACGSPFRINGARNVRLSQFVMPQGRTNFSKALVFELAYAGRKDELRLRDDYSLYAALLNRK